MKLTSRHDPRRQGERVRRTRRHPPPCFKCPKITAWAKGEEANLRQYSFLDAVEPSERSLLTYQHYLECRAVGHFPDDPIVRRNARIIRQAMDGWEQEPVQQLVQLLSVGMLEVKRR